MTEFNRYIIQMVETRMGVSEEMLFHKSHRRALGIMTTLLVEDGRLTYRYVGELMNTSLYKARRAHQDLRDRTEVEEIKEIVKGYWGYNSGAMS
jgi:hypothetical protein